MGERQSTDISDNDRAQEGLRSHILSAATELVNREGRDALTTRAVAAAAGVQVPTLYRLFGDKRGLEEAVAAHGFALYLREKTVRAAHPDPVEDLRAGWDLHVGFGLAYPALFTIMYGDPRAGMVSAAEAKGLQLLRERTRRLAVAGRLRVSEARAVDLMRAAGCGTVMTLLTMPEDQRDGALSEDAREAVLAALTTEAPTVAATGTAGAAIALLASLTDEAALTAGERSLLAEWLDRLAGHP